LQVPFGTKFIFIDTTADIASEKSKPIEMSASGGKRSDKSRLEKIILAVK